MQQDTSRGFIAYLIATAVICGALVMVIEVLGSRVIGPFFGVSLFVWTSLITVTLVALAAGYAAGGHFADRRSDPGYLYAIIFLSGLSVAIIPLIKVAVLKACVPLGLRLGALASASLLFGPALFLLGCVSPYVVKIAAREMHNIGRTVGSFYALSTVGSFVGTLATGFVLIAYFGVNRIFMITGFLLIGLGAGYFVFFRRKWAALVLLLVPLFFLPPESSHSKTLANGMVVTRVHGEDSFYGKLAVVDYRQNNVQTRELIIDGLVQGGVDPGNGMSVYEYPYLMEFLPYALNPSGKTCLVIGMGAGVVPRWYREHGVHTEVVDIDPQVVAIARDYFGYGDTGSVHVEDARYFLNSTGKKYDYLVLDVFNGDTTPGHLLSLEAMRLIRQRLNGGGIVAVNLVGSIGQHRYMTVSVVRTLQQVFANVEIYPLFPAEQKNATGNIALIAYDGAPRKFDPAALASFPVHPLAEPIVRASLRAPFRFPDDAPGIVLTDDYNPVDFYDLWLKEQVRRTIIETTDWDILAG